MKNDAKLKKDAMRVLKETSRTFYIPIKLLNPTLRMTVGSAYLCMRAIDEIEDHPSIEPEVKKQLLQTTSQLLNEESFNEKAYQQLIQPFENLLPEVTKRLGEWIAVCPGGIGGKVKESTSIMADGMAKWAYKNWKVHTKEDLDEYTYYVAGLVGVMLSDIWEWYDGTKTDRTLAIGYGRGLQAVNMLRNQKEDAERGVSFLPEGWGRKELFAYAKENLQMADEYIKDIQTKNILLFCKIPLELAKRTLQALESGKEKMTRDEVVSAVDRIINN